MQTTPRLGMDAEGVQARRAGGLYAYREGDHRLWGDEEIEEKSKKRRKKKKRKKKQRRKRRMARVNREIEGQLILLPLPRERERKISPRNRGMGDVHLR